MKNKSALNIFIILLFLSSNIFGQSGIIEGNINDKNSAEPIPFASLVVYPASGSTPVLGSVSEENGFFRLVGLEHGNYKLVISFIGYQSDTIHDIFISRQSPKWNVGTVNLNISTQLLEEVEIREFASTQSNKIDRKVYTASDFETAKGGNAIDVLNKLPSVSVDPDGIVSVRGTSDFMVYLNGKPTQMDPSMMLGQIAADAILKIELISIPTAKFDAQGKGGIINITTRKTGPEGFSMLVNGLVGGAPWYNLEDEISGFKQNDNRYGSGLNLMYSKEKFSAYGGLYGNRRNVNGSRTGDARLLQDDGSYFHMVAGGERPEWFQNYSVNTGFDLKVTDKSELSASYFYGNRNEGRSAFYVYNTFFGAADKSEIVGVPMNQNWIYNPNTDERFGVFHTINIDFNSKISDNKELKLSALYENSKLSRNLDNRNYAFNPNDQSV